jgi:hypothetical protein
MILETVLWWMPRSDAMRFSAVPSVCADRIDATTATVTPWQRIQTRVASCIAVRNPSAVASKATRRTPTGTVTLVSVGDLGGFVG